jgi:hypothetical protein
MERQLHELGADEHDVAVGQLTGDLFNQTIGRDPMLGGEREILVLHALHTLAIQTENQLAGSGDRL